MVVSFIVKLDSKRSPGTDFAVEETKENILLIFVYIALNLNIQNLEFKSNIHSITIAGMGCMLRMG